MRGLRPAERTALREHAARPRSPYAAGKVATELLADIYRPRLEDGRQLGIVRFFNTFGPHEDPDAVVPAFLDAVAENRPLTIEGDGTQARDLTYIEDAVTMLTRILDAPALLPVVNCGSGQAVSISDLARAVIRTAGRGTITHTTPGSTRSPPSPPTRPCSPACTGPSTACPWTRRWLSASRPARAPWQRPYPAAERHTHPRGQAVRAARGPGPAPLPGRDHEPPPSRPTPTGKESVNDQTFLLPLTDTRAIRITGGHRLQGTTSVQGSKNIALHLYAGALLADEPLTLTGIPHILDTQVCSEILTRTGTPTRVVGDRFETAPATAWHPAVPDELGGRIRTTAVLAAGLLARAGRVRFPCQAATPSATGSSTGTWPPWRPPAPPWTSPAPTSRPT